MFSGVHPIYLSEGFVQVLSSVPSLYFLLPIFLSVFLSIYFVQISRNPLCRLYLVLQLRRGRLTRAFSAPSSICFSGKRSRRLSSSRSSTFENPCDGFSLSFVRLQLLSYCCWNKKFRTVRLVSQSRQQWICSPAPMTRHCSSLGWDGLPGATKRSRHVQVLRKGWPRVLYV